MYIAHIGYRTRFRTNSWNMTYERKGRLICYFYLLPLSPFVLFLLSCQHFKSDAPAGPSTCMIKYHVSLKNIHSEDCPLYYILPIFKYFFSARKKIQFPAFTLALNMGLSCSSAA
jgi:hypothetical protein